MKNEQDDKGSAGPGGGEGAGGGGGGGAAAGGVPAVFAGAAAQAGVQAGDSGAVAAGADGGAVEIRKVGKKNFAAVYIAATEEQRRRAAAPGATEEDRKLGVSRVVKLSDQEAIVLRAFLDTRDFELAAKEAGFKEDGVTPRISVESVKRMLRRPNLKAVLEAEILKATAAEGMGITWVFSEARQIYEGDKVKNDNQIKTLKIIADLVKPRTGPHAGPMQQNNISINSVYAGQAREATEARLERAREAAGEE